jgi:hypothetical protein
MSWLSWVGVVIGCVVLGFIFLAVAGPPIAYFLGRVARFVHPPRPYGPGNYYKPSKKESKEILERLSLEEMEEIMRRTRVEIPRRQPKQDGDAR